MATIDEYMVDENVPKTLLVSPNALGTLLKIVSLPLGREEVAVHRIGDALVMSQPGVDVDESGNRLPKLETSATWSETLNIDLSGRSDAIVDDHSHDAEAVHRELGSRTLAAFFEQVRRPRLSNHPANPSLVASLGRPMQDEPSLFAALARTFHQKDANVEKVDICMETEEVEQGCKLDLVVYRPSLPREVDAGGGMSNLTSLDVWLESEGGQLRGAASPASVPVESSPDAVARAASRLVSTLGSRCTREDVSYWLTTTKDSKLLLLSVFEEEEEEKPRVKLISKWSIDASGSLDEEELASDTETSNPTKTSVRPLSPYAKSMAFLCIRSACALASTNQNDQAKAMAQRACQWLANDTSKPTKILRAATRLFLCGQAVNPEELLAIERGVNEMSHAERETPKKDIFSGGGREGEETPKKDIFSGGGREGKETPKKDIFSGGGREGEKTPNKHEEGHRDGLARGEDGAESPKSLVERVEDVWRPALECVGRMVRWGRGLREEVWREGLACVEEVGVEMLFGVGWERRLFLRSLALRCGLLLAKCSAALANEAVLTAEVLVGMTEPVHRPPMHMVVRWARAEAAVLSLEKGRKGIGSVLSEARTRAAVCGEAEEVEMDEKDLREFWMRLARQTEKEVEEHRVQPSGRIRRMLHSLASGTKTNDLEAAPSPPSPRLPPLGAVVARAIPVQWDPSPAAQETLDELETAVNEITTAARSGARSRVLRTAPQMLQWLETDDREEMMGTRGAKFCGLLQLSIAEVLLQSVESDQILQAPTALVRAGMLLGVPVLGPVDSDVGAWVLEVFRHSNDPVQFREVSRHTTDHFREVSRHTTDPVQAVPRHTTDHPPSIAWLRKLECALSYRAASTVWTLSRHPSASLPPPLSRLVSQMLPCPDWTSASGGRLSVCSIAVVLLCRALLCAPGDADSLSLLAQIAKERFLALPSVSPTVTLHGSHPIHLSDIDVSSLASIGVFALHHQLLQTSQPPLIHLNIAQFFLAIAASEFNEDDTSSPSLAISPVLAPMLRAIVGPGAYNSSSSTSKPAEPVNATVLAAETARIIGPIWAALASFAASYTYIRSHPDLDYLPDLWNDALERGIAHALRSLLNAAKKHPEFFAAAPPTPLQLTEPWLAQVPPVDKIHAAYKAFLLAPRADPAASTSQKASAALSALFHAIFN